MSIRLLTTNDMATGIFFTAGILSFWSGQFILSTALFGMGCLATKPIKAKPVRV